MVEERQRRLNNLEKDIDSIFTRAAVHVGLSDSAFDILYALEAYGDGCSQKDLCERCWMGKQTINSSIKRLCEQGILEKTAGPGRTTTISLTRRCDPSSRPKRPPCTRSLLPNLRKRLTSSSVTATRLQTPLLRKAWCKPWRRIWLSTSRSPSFCASRCRRWA